MFPLVHLATFDPNTLYAAIAADALSGGTRFGITNLTDPCLPGFATSVPPISCNISLFADGLHPTTRAQAILGQFALGSVVPEPATMTLVGLGLVMLGASRRRARRR